jgi:hypothetical protein
MSAHDPAGSIPFLDIGNAYAQLSVLPPYGPQDLAGLTWGLIAASLGDPSNLRQITRLAATAGLDIRDLESGLVRLALVHQRARSSCPGGDQCGILALS